MINFEGFLFGMISYKRYVFGNMGIYSVSVCLVYVCIDVNMFEFCLFNILEVKFIL